MVGATVAGVEVVVVAGVCDATVGSSEVKVDATAAEATSVETTDISALVGTPSSEPGEHPTSTETTTKLDQTLLSPPVIRASEESLIGLAAQQRRAG